MPYISRAVVKSDWLNIAAIDTSKDALIDRLISYADSEIDEICQQPIRQQSLTITFAGTHDFVYHTGYTVPLTVTTLSSRDSYADSFAAVSGTTTVIDREGAKSIFNDNGFTSLEYELVMTIGYATVPSVFEISAGELVTEMYFNTPFAPQTNRFGISATSESEAGISIGKTLIKMRDRIRPRLLPYVRVRI